MKSISKKVNELLLDIQTTFPEKLETIEKIRQIFFDENSEIEEHVKYGGIIFNSSDKLIGGIYLYKQHISIEFSKGATFKDVNNLLEGRGNMRRHLKILEQGDIKEKNVRSYIKQAVKR